MITAQIYCKRILTLEGVKGGQIFYRNNNVTKHGDIICIFEQFRRYCHIELHFYDTISVVIFQALAKKNRVNCSITADARLKAKKEQKKGGR